MNTEQKKAIKRLKLALNNCAKAGLTGGVYDGSFCIWESYFDPEAEQIAGNYRDFFHAVEEEGETIMCNMALDGGAGV